MEALQSGVRGALSTAKTEPTGGNGLDKASEAYCCSFFYSRETQLSQNGAAVRSATVVAQTINTQRIFDLFLLFKVSGAL
jgi:hypothetical protein